MNKDKDVFEEKQNPFKENIEENKEAENEEKVEQQEESLEEKLQKEKDELNNKYLRLAADFDNYRKRQALERENLLQYGAGETLTKLIDVLDTFERAEESVEKFDDCKTVKESYNVAIKQFKDTLTKCGLEKIDTKNQKFDPNFHEAVSQTPTNDVEEGTIIAEMRTGYKLKDRVLRPSMVSVAVSEE
ncbi:MAG: nucleotide exchange factor GrpE [Cyanobacteria bacterium SIG30]|nr:nucleotide exchange factor GrpE [Cyanobacteria bacterium SIG30]